MAEAMLDPILRQPPHNKTTSPTGNTVRQQIILRMLQAAKLNGWELVKISDVNNTWERKCALWRAGLGPDPGPPPN
jgi:hypothetical protein